MNLPDDEAADLRIAYVTGWDEALAVMAPEVDALRAQVERADRFALELSQIGEFGFAERLRAALDGPA